MSCGGNRTGEAGLPMIPAGLGSLPRQMADFAEFRRRLIADIAVRESLGKWRPQRSDDLGVMLLEMAAYVLDALGFYDEVIANECFLRTARRGPSVRKLVGLIGYRPRPAVAASVRLALLVDGNRPVAVPAGTQFRSAAVGKEPPQIFETVADHVARPDRNSSLLVSVVNERSAVEGVSELLLGSGAAKLTSGDIVVLRADTGTFLHAGAVQAADSARDSSGRTLAEVTLAPEWQAPAAPGGRAVQVIKATQRASLWAMEHVEGDPLPVGGDDNPLLRPSIKAQAPRYEYSGPSAQPTRVTQQPTIQNALMGFTQRAYLSAQNLGRTLYPTSGSFEPISGRGIAQGAQSRQSEPQRELALKQVPTGTDAAKRLGAGNVLTLDGLYRQIKVRDYVVLDWGSGPEVHQVTKTTEHAMHLSSDEDTPAPMMPVTQLTLASSIDIDEDEAARLLVYYGFLEAGALVSREPTELSAAGTARFTGTLSGLAGTGECIDVLAEDGRGMGAGGTLSGAALSLDTPEESVLVRPVTVYANVVQATRGETVNGEVLGSGDAGLANQSFSLKKRPLTYLSKPAPDNESGVGNTLEVRVNNVLWREVPSFYGIGPDEQAYVVRDDGDGGASVVFGDGVGGARLPSGSGNVVANYRFGAGAVRPPAGTITQLARPVKGLRAVRNPVAAYGGDDAEAAEHVRSRAPASALILGRAVSVKDFEAVAAGVAGVKAVHAEWIWDDERQRPVVSVAFVGDENLEPTVARALLALSDPTVLVRVVVAEREPVHLRLEVETDGRYQPVEVERAVTAALVGDKTGLLVPERLGVGQPVFRSRVLAAVHSVPGLVSVTAAFINGAPFSAPAVLPSLPHCYLDFTVTVGPSIRRVNHAK